MRGTLQSVDGVKRMALPNVGGLHPVGGRESKRDFPLPPRVDKGFLPAFRLKPQHRLFLSLELNELQTRTTSLALLVLRPLHLDGIIGSPRPPANSPCSPRDLPTSMTV